ncbi:hypothetical protein CP10139811_0341 [Chlamydia ibidis]|uniref:SMI1/KNR4 family protein n=2 Tax=Chlamydia ibidis TaxID=1405396 RepID=S7J276_9CHLA|nr:hypothetical protein [Chlamydia ibidis]EPP34333.1 hypothetical protein CP10139811_0341 [Chlamydia ibidis]EQM63160.1 hypothetical protein H359_0414 [Chlamydia ibidis 10-1398/6]
MKKSDNPSSLNYFSSPLDVKSVEELRKEFSWEEISIQIPRLPRGWYELVGLEKKDRIDLCREYWLSILGLKDDLALGICRFFALLESIDVYVYRTSKGPYSVKMLYTFVDGRCSFQGSPPLSETTNLCLPILGDDHYHRFFTIHNGFGKWEDGGIFSYRALAKVQHKLRNYLIHMNKISPEEDCSSLGVFPFYGYEEPCAYQCFLVDPEVRRDFPSLNLLISETSLFKRDLENIEILCSDSRYYPSFITWFENYLNE